MTVVLAWLFSSISSPVTYGSFFSENTIEEIQAKLKRLPEQGRHKTKAILYTELGMRFYRQGRYPEAVQAFDNALINKTTKAMRRQIYVYLGKSHQSMSRLDKAIQAYEQAVQLDRKDWRWHRDLGLLYAKTQLYRKAIDSFETALKLDRKEEASLYFELGRVWRQMGLYKKGEPHLKKALAKGHERGLVYRELSYLFEGQGRLEEAKQSWATVLEPNASTEDVARLIYLSVLAGDKSTASAGYRQLKAMNPGKDTLQFYDNLVESQTVSTDQILSLDFASAPLRILIDSYFHEDIPQ